MIDDRAAYHSPNNAPSFQRRVVEPSCIPDALNIIEAVNASVGHKFQVGKFRRQAVYYPPAGAGARPGS